MPISAQNLKDANAEMLGNTNRGILFTTVNLSKEAPRLSNYLSDMAANIYTWDQFREIIQQKFTVKSFPEFLDKFQPCFYYRLAPPQEPVSVELGDSASTEETGVVDNDEEGTGVAATDESAEDGGEAADDEIAAEVTLNAEGGDEEFALARALPEYEFSLEGGPAELGWKRVAITMDHPLFKNLQQHLKDKALTSKTTVDVVVDDALWGFKPKSAKDLLVKSAQDFKSSSKKLALEMKRNPNSPETRGALESYDRRLKDLENAIGDDLRVLPTITAGLAAARKALGSGGGKGGPLEGQFMLEIGEKAQVLVRPALPSETIKGLPGAEEQAALEAGSGSDSKELAVREKVPLARALQSRPLVERNVTDIVKLNDDEQYPALVGTLMNDMVRRHKINPVMGNMLAVVLQDPQQLALWNIAPKEVEVFHDTFLGIYSMSVERFLKVVVPMFETIMGVFALFNEFPADVRRGQPELIVANDELTDLWQIYNEELSMFLYHTCLQAGKFYRDAISFAIVPSVAPFKNKAPAGPPSGYIRAGSFVEDFNNPSTPRTKEDVSRLQAEFDHLRKKGAGDTGGFGRVAGAPEVMGLMVLGKECGLTVLFSPENAVIAGRTTPSDMDALQENYTPASVVDKEWAIAGMLCLPDFVCLPPDGMLFTGNVMDGRSVGVEVPQIIIRSCYVAAGRLMANDNPEVLKSQINKLPLEMSRRLKVRPMLPGLSLNLGQYPMLGKTNLAPDHFLSDAIIRSLVGRDKSFLVFAHIHGQSPNIAAARTLMRVRGEYGERFVDLHHARQQQYLLRLLYAAYWKGFGGEWPSPAEMNGLMDQITNWIGWYDMQREGYVNSFPSELREDVIVMEPVLEGGAPVSYILNMNFKDAVIGPLTLNVEQ